MLTLNALIFFIKTLATKGFVSIWYHHKCLIQLFPIHLNTYVMGLRLLEIFLLLHCRDRLKSSASDVCRRQILTTNVYPRAVKVKAPITLMIGWSSVSTCLVYINLTITTLKYFCINRRFFHLKIIRNVSVRISASFMLSYIYVMGLQPL